MNKKTTKYMFMCAEGYGDYLSVNTNYVFRYDSKSQMEEIFSTILKLSKNGSYFSPQEAIQENLISYFIDNKLCFGYTARNADNREDVLSDYEYASDTLSYLHSDIDDEFEMETISQFSKKYDSDCHSHCQVTKWINNYD